MVIFQNGKKFEEYKFYMEEELEREVTNNYHVLFGESTIYIDAKRKVEAKALGGVVPDGFLFDLSDKDEPEFYIVEIELKSHDFYNHIFPQITKLFAFFRNKKSQGELIEKIFSIINTSNELKKEFKKYLGEKEIYKFLKDTIENSQNILLIIDDDKDELPEIMDTYTDTWGKIVKKIIFKKFIHGENVIYLLEPDFRRIEFAGAESVDKIEPKEYSEEFHLEDVSDEIKNAYFSIKEKLLELNPELVFNPQKYYISVVYGRNIAFFKIKKKKIRLVIMLPEEEVRKRIKNHIVKHLSEGVQRFYNGPCCEIIIENSENINEIIQLFNYLIMERS